MLKERARENVKYYPHDHGLTFKKERQSPFRPVFKALSVIKASYSLTILAIALLSFFLEYIIGYK
ncbi:MAG: hypothetical protein Q8O17_05830, partial [Candidatus Methanoperedens sp.]|nr:hypothetical protein [Candidatus Methanoperedens sp.]